MELVIDGRTMAVSTPSGVPVMDISLVLGDTVPVRIRVDHALTDCTPALAVKQSIGSADLIMTVTDWTREDDWQTASWVINTVPLQAALGNADSVALVAEVVLVAPDGAQHTSRPIRMTVRRDILPAEFAPPAEVLADWSRLVAAALSSQLPAALQEAGVSITPVTGSSTLSTGEAETPTVMACYALTWGDELLAGHLTDSCRLRRVTMTYYTDTGLMDAHWLRVWRLEGGKYVVIGVATAVALPINNQPIAWDFAPGVPLQRGDKIMLEICAGPDAERLTTRGLGVHAVITTAKDGRGMASSVHYPPEITMATMAPMMTVTVDYDEGVSVGGVELATATQVQVLGSDVRTASANSQAAAQSASTARDQAQAAVAGLSVTVGTVTTGAPGTQAAATMTPGSTPGSWRMDMTIPRGDVGVVDTTRAYTWTQPQTYNAAINANGGINIPVSPVTDTDAARLREVRVLNEIANADAGNYFGFSAAPYGRLLTPLVWRATYWPKPQTDNGWVDFAYHCEQLGGDFDRGGSYTGTTGIFFPLSCCLGYQRMFNVVAGGLHHVTLNEEWTGPDDHPFTSPSEGVSMWWDVYFQDRDADNNIPVRGRLCRYNHTTGQVELLTKTALLPDNYRLRGIAIAWARAGSGDGGIWVVGCNEANNGRLEAYRVCDDTWPTSSYHACVNAQHIRLLCNRGALDVGVGALKTYPGIYGQQNVVAEWCKMMEVK